MRFTGVFFRQKSSGLFRALADFSAKTALNCVMNARRTRGLQKTVAEKNP
jgi:hypothetical protein